MEAAMNTHGFGITCSTSTYGYKDVIIRLHLSYGVQNEQEKTQPTYYFHARRSNSMNPSGWVCFIQTKETFKQLANWTNKYITMFNLETRTDLQ